MSLCFLFFSFASFNAAETLGMEGNVTERRLSVAVTPLWLDSSNTSIAPPVSVTTDSNMTREVSPRPETTEDGLPPNKVQITAEVPRILLPTRHRGVTETFENTEVEELIAMLRETENLEDQGDILQYLVDTQGLDYNTGDYRYQMKNLLFSFGEERNAASEFIHKRCAFVQALIGCC